MLRSDVDEEQQINIPTKPESPLDIPTEKQKGTLACIGGICKYVDFSTPEAIAACNGKAEGDTCGLPPVEPVIPPDCYLPPDGKTCKEGYRLIGKILSGVPRMMCCPIEPPPKPKLACVHGVCQEGGSSDPIAIAACNGKAKGDPCGFGPHTCTSDKDCEEGYHCVDGRCEKIEYCTADKDCPEGYVCKDGKCVKKEGNGEGAVGGEFKWSSDVDALLKRILSQANNLLNQPVEAFSYSPEAQAALARMFQRGNELLDRPEYKSSPETQALLARIFERANMLLDQPLGLSDEERQAIYNRIFEKIKGTERSTIQSAMDKISRQGLLGSPYAEREVTGIQRGTRETLAGAERDIEIEEAQRRFDQLMQTTQMVQSLFGTAFGAEQTEEQRRFDELMGTTGMAQSLFGTGMTAEEKAEAMNAARRGEGLQRTALAQSLLGTGMSAEQMTEALNAARRGEGSGALAMLLQYLSTMGGQNNYYWQAILNKLLQEQG